ncbi:MAG: hypothetical protein ACK48R_12680 [Planctomyces sp.]
MIYADTRWQCNFLSRLMWTAQGVADGYLLVFLQLGSRRVWISPSTVQPDSAWVGLQARIFTMVTEDIWLPPDFTSPSAEATTVDLKLIIPRCCSPKSPDYQGTFSQLRIFSPCGACDSCNNHAVRLCCYPASPLLFPSGSIRFPIETRSVVRSSHVSLTFCRVGYLHGLFFELFRG